MNRRALTAVPGLTAVLLATLVVISPLRAPARAAGGPVNVAYAGSLVNVNEDLIGPAFSAATGYVYQGKAAGSAAIANQIKGKIIQPDIVELADPAMNRLLMGAANGNYVSWYLTFAGSQLVIGFDPRSRFAAAFRQVQHHTLPFYRALEQRGLRIGRTDPALDPKGYRALWMANLTQRVFHQHNFTRRIFGAVENPSQVFPEETLVARLLTGQLDAGVFYLSEVRDLGIPYIALPSQVNLGSNRYAKLYATQRYTPPTGPTVMGGPIRYTITIPSTARNARGATAFVRFVLSTRIRTIAQAHGLLSVPITVGGDRKTLPADLRPLVGVK
ncbi:MAG TPA: extracellular solute-binding protein [Chloroflexota bacterium]|nr:extracellular solute-binding protein [Chloroflexota bacterium]